MSFVLGIDQGSSHTRAAVADHAGNILGYGRAPGACHSIHGMDRAMGAIHEAAIQALGRAGMAPENVSLLYGGLTGADWPDEYDLLREHLRALSLSDEVHVTNDSIIALRGGSSAAAAAILIAGSGGNCALRSPEGKEWIYHYYQEPELQGGQALGEQALRAIYRSATWREPRTRLTSLVLDLTGLATVDELLRAHVERRMPDGWKMDIAPLVFQAASEGDLVAATILHRFGTGLAELVTAGTRHLEMTGLDVDVVLSGSIFKGEGTLLREVITAQIHLVAPRARIIEARYEPVVGAVLLALERHGCALDENVMANIEHSSGRLGLIRLARAAPDRE